MVSSTTAADAPAKVVEIVTCGGTMSGNCATGMRNSDRTPASVIRIAMTIARRGRSTKTAEIIRLLSRRLGCGWWWRGRARRDLDSRPDSLNAVHHDHIAFVEGRSDQ